VSSSGTSFSSWNNTKIKIKCIYTDTVQTELSQVEGNREHGEPKDDQEPRQMDKLENELQKLYGNNINRGFDTLYFSYSLIYF
jgi:hypothetical protein